MFDLDKCRVVSKGTSFIRSESGKTIIFASETEFVCQVIDIDNCAFKKEQFRRCDFLFLVPVNKTENTHLVNVKSRAYFVELKGDDIKSACEQLFNTIEKIKTQLLNFELHAIVVGTAAYQPEIEENEYFRKVRKMIKRDIVFRKVHKVNKFTHTEYI